MRYTIFENHRKDKTDVNYYIAVITKKNTIESGWTNGRYLEEIKKDFGEYEKDWFYTKAEAEAYLFKNKLK